MGENNVDTLIAFNSNEIYNSTFRKVYFLKPRIKNNRNVDKDFIKYCISRFDLQAMGLGTILLINENEVILSFNIELFHSVL